MDPMKLFVILDGAVRGPFDRDRLRQLAEDGVIGPATETAETATGPWRKFQEIPEVAGLLPRRRTFEFKAKTYENVNQAPAPAVDHRDLIVAANRSLRPDAIASPPPAEAPRPGEVGEILQSNREREKQAGFDELKPMPRRRHRRFRDYLLLLILGNGLCVASIVAGNAIFGVAGMVLFTAAITWVMFVVMDRY